MHRHFEDPAIRVSLLLIATVLTLGALKISADIFAPVVLAVVTGIFLAPVTDFFEKMGIPARFAAVIVLVMGLALLGFIMFLIEPMIWTIAEALPQIRLEIRAWIYELRGLIRGLDEVNREVEEALGGNGTSAANGEEGASPMPDMSTALFLAPVILMQALIFVGTLFFFLMTRKNIYRWLSRYIGTEADTEIILGRFTAVERLVSHYFVTISSINAGLGVSLGALLMAIGMPGALIWGVAAFLLNFILYLGPVILVGALLVSGIVVFDGIMSVVPAAIFLCLNMIEGQFLTPALVGRFISVNPLLIFVSLVFWLWLWGPIGGIIAIPLLVFILVMLDIFDPEEDLAEVETET
ncbi:AI-2E family transporter [Roseovarius sp. SCSIO 43702]|uniref:AI-2E family transporter n=1 Tax=Roseovarius sp. SCSIO 43702 TaxID=2823043 RepID=UPI001C73C977|nr:AI-2E family transporter [Roseovarius sp. SCSIO 43702]QYX57795.1 AI-2E family transporter [Roseovarius sp. SCSIO 43702]